MIVDPARAETVDAADAALREQLARQEAAAGTIVPVLRYLLGSEDHALFSEEVVARVRGMVDDLARQLLERCTCSAEGRELAPPPPGAVAPLSETLLQIPALLRHTHALALEWQLTRRLESSHVLDPVCPPLLQALIGSSEPATAELAMQVLAAQARFRQSQRRMRLPLGELPGDVLHAVLLALRDSRSGDEDTGRGGSDAEEAIRAEYDEARGRLGLVSRLVVGLGAGSVAALAVAHAGAAIFISALAIALRQDRDSVAVAAAAPQPARLAVSLRAAGIKPSAADEQLLALCPAGAVPSGLDRLSAEEASVMLGAVTGWTGS